MGYGTKIKELLKRQNLTIKELSDRSGISLNTLYSITKRDSKKIDPVILVKIANCLGVAVTEFDDSYHMIFSNSFSSLFDDKISRINKLIESQNLTQEFVIKTCNKENIDFHIIQNESILKQLLIKDPYEVAKVLNTTPSYLYGLTDQIDYHDKDQFERALTKEYYEFLIGAKTEFTDAMSQFFEEIGFSEMLNLYIFNLNRTGKEEVIKKAKELVTNPIYHEDRSISELLIPKSNSRKLNN